MRVITILFLCCFALCTLGWFQTSVCQTDDPINHPTPCSRLFGLMGTVVCVGATWYILSAKK
jgi:hypothetical protein